MEVYIHVAHFGNIFNKIAYIGKGPKQPKIQKSYLIRRYVNHIFKKSKSTDEEYIQQPNGKVISVYFLHFFNFRNQSFNSYGTCERKISIDSFLIVKFIFDQLKIVFNRKFCFYSQQGYVESMDRVWKRSRVKFFSYLYLMF